MKKIFVVLATRNESDIIESFCRYNLTFCDGMIIYERQSSDNTNEIIRKLISEGLPIHLYDDPNIVLEPFAEGNVTTAMAYRAINEYGADLVIPLDTDEFLYHTDGINPRATLETLREDVEYQVPWRTYVYEKEPNIKLGFMPNNFTQYRNPALEKIQGHAGTTFISKYLIQEKKAKFYVGAHWLVYPEENIETIKIENPKKLVCAHFPIRGKSQVIRKAIPNWIIKWITTNRVPRDSLDNFQLGILFNILKNNGDISTEEMKKHSVDYSLYNLSQNVQEIQKTIKKLQEKKQLTRKEPMDVFFCINKLKLRYTNYNEKNKEFIQAVLKEIDKVVTFLSAESDEKSVLLEKTKAEFITQRNNLIAERDGLIAERDGLLNSRSWRITKPLRDLAAFVRRHKVLRLFAKGLLSLKRKGIIITINKIFLYMLRKCSTQYTVKQKQSQNSSVIAPVITEAIKNNDVRFIPFFRALQNIPSFVDEQEKVRINLVTDSIEKHSLLGGVATALIIATEFANKCGIPLRIITRITPVDPLDYKKIIRLNNIKEPDDVSFYTDYDRDENGKKNFKLDISKKDIFIATSWWSATAISKTCLTERFFYVLQEVETFFYPHGEEHYFCSKIMQKNNIDYIVNSKYLFDYFKDNTPNIVENGIYFTPAFSKNLYQKKNFIKKTKYSLFFYARPNNPRNLFHYGVYLLNKAFERGILDTSEWDVYLVGQNTPKIIFNNRYEAINKGLLDWDQYATFLSNVDLAVSLMYTPHPSYPPYDVACSGGVVVSNLCLNKTEFPECKNVLLGDLEENAFLETIKKGIILAKDIKERKKNFENSTIQRSWPDTLKDVLLFMEQKSKNVFS